MKSRGLFWFTGFTIVLLSVSQVFAYDVDTHFYSTYAMARHAGIRHEVAVKIATATQWMDESYISDPTSMIILPITGVRKRRLLHFPSARRVGSVNAQVQGQVLGFDTWMAGHKSLIETLIHWFHYDGSEDDLKALNLWTETEEGNEFASEMLMEGLKEGDLMKASASIHIIEDSYAHAGTPAEEGHAKFWHWPDRPFEAPEKYARMVRNVFQALIAIRSQLPPEAIDTNLRTVGPNPNSTLNSKDLAESYFAKVAPVISANVLYDRAYVTTALSEFLKLAKEQNYLTLEPNEAQNLMAYLSIDGSTDTYKEMEKAIRFLWQPQYISHLHVRHILADMGKLPENSTLPLQKYISSYGETESDTEFDSSNDADSLSNFVTSMSHNLLRWSVPYPLSVDHRMELENDSSKVRHFEMDLRESRMREFIQSEFHINIKFVGNPTSDELGFGKEIRMEKDIEPTFVPEPGVISATFNGKEKNHFDHMIFHYLFPHMGKKELATIVRVIHDYKTAPFYKMNIALENAAYYLTPMLPTFLKDTINERQNPKPDDRFYRNPKRMAEMRANGTVRPLLGAADFWHLADLGLTTTSTIQP